MDENIQKSFEKLLSYIESENFKGYDPYDALNSTFISSICFKSKWLKIAFIQFFRRSPVNFRSIFGISKNYNPKGIGLFLQGYSKLYAINKNEIYLEKIKFLLNLLDKIKSPGYSGNCWGYNFAWQSRLVYRPENTPTIVNSSFIGHALLDCFELTNNQKSLDMAISIKDFILRDLNRKIEDEVFCFSYTPIDDDYVHNANILGASFLIRLFSIIDDKELKENALGSLGYCLKYQRQDGSWLFAETNIQSWVDSFHTGFVLESLRWFKNNYSDLILNSYEAGIKYYIDNFFLLDGTPKYYDNKIYPIDIHSAAEAVYFFSGMGRKYKSFTDTILKWMLDNMSSKKGFFYFRKTKYYTNKIPYMRWAQAWSFRALTEYQYHF